MIETKTHEKIWDYAYKIGQIKGTIKAYQRWGLSATDALKQIEEIANKEEKGE